MDVSVSEWSAHLEVSRTRAHMSKPIIFAEAIYQITMRFAPNQASDKDDQTVRSFNWAIEVQDLYVRLRRFLIARLLD